MIFKVFRVYYIHMFSSVFWNKFAAQALAEQSTNNPLPTTPKQPKFNNCAKMYQVLSVMHGCLRY